MNATADVVIIGAGVIGCSTAYHLAQLGARRVAVLEMDQVGAGTSSKSAAMFTLQFCWDPLTIEMAQRAYTRYMSFEEELGVPIDFRPIGWLNLAAEDNAPVLREQAALLQSRGVTTELLAPIEVKERYPELNTEDIVLATYGPDDGSFDPHMIMSGYIGRARQLGVAVREGVRALDISVEQDRVVGVVTSHGPIATKTVINAAGPWAAQVGGWAGVQVPLRNAARTIVVTQPIATFPRQRPFVEDLATGWYIRPELGGVLMGMGVTPVNEPAVELDQAQVAAIIDRAVYRVPLLEQAELLTAWTGVRPLTPDGQAIVGPVPEVEGLILNCGWGGVGLMMAPLAGEMVAEMVLHGAASTGDWQELRPDRFPLAGTTPRS